MASNWKRSGRAILDLLLEGGVANLPILTGGHFASKINQAISEWLVSAKKLAYPVHVPLSCLKRFLNVGQLRGWEWERKPGGNRMWIAPP
jgi:hypothetical protein